MQEWLFGVLQWLFTWLLNIGEMVFPYVVGIAAVLTIFAILGKGVGVDDSM